MFFRCVEERNFRIIDKIMEMKFFELIGVSKWYTNRQRRILEAIDMPREHHLKLTASNGTRCTENLSVPHSNAPPSGSMGNSFWPVHLCFHITECQNTKI